MAGAGRSIALSSMHFKDKDRAEPLHMFLVLKYHCFVMSQQCACDNYILAQLLPFLE